ncbi:aminopeptidase [Candidatus Woesearchaeota archaeon]|nr:aminopeptidase [Candidatus Woesearchaeota archaeon]
MADPRAKKLADILVNYSIKAKKGEYIELNFGVDAKELALECYKLLLKKGALPVVNVGVPGFGYAYYKNASDDQLKTFPKIADYESKLSAGTISISAEMNTKEMTKINPKKIAMRRKVVNPIHDREIKKDNWVYCQFPTNALAQDAEMSLEEFEDFVYEACLKDWKKESRKQDKLKKLLDKGKQVRIVGEHTDLNFSIDGRQGIKCDGHRNMPDGEVFIAPVENTTEGFIKYTYPAIYGGREVDGVYLRFHKGKVVEAKADKGEAFLKEMIKTDKGSNKLGEFGIGLNFDIKNFVKQILFDEKIGGTIHLALGMAYPEGGGKNKSALHWDMIKDLRRGGAFYVDGKCIQKNGKWMVDI